MTTQENKFENELKQCLDQIKVDHLPLNDILRTFSGFDKLTPSDNDFLNTLDLIKILMEGKNVICLEGPEMTQSNKSVTELLNFLKSKWDAGKYDEINYGFWFDENEIKPRRGSASE
jgi:hypothetical protein